MVGSDITNFPFSATSVPLYSGDGGVSWTPQSTTLPASQQILSGLAAAPTAPEPAGGLLLLSAIPLAVRRKEKAKRKGVQRIPQLGFNA